MQTTEKTDSCLTALTLSTIACQERSHPRAINGFEAPVRGVCDRWLRPHQLSRLLDLVENEENVLHVASLGEKKAMDAPE